MSATAEKFGSYSRAGISIFMSILESIVLEKLNY